MLEAPNAEHSSLKGEHTQALHLCSPGSVFASGMFDAHNKFLFRKHGYTPACGEHWKVAVDRMMAGLIYPDNGGVTINHPSWSRLNKGFVHKAEGQECVFNRPEGDHVYLRLKAYSVDSAGETLFSQPFMLDA